VLPLGELHCICAAVECYRRQTPISKILLAPYIFVGGPVIIDITTLLLSGETADGMTKYAYWLFASVNYKQQCFISISTSCKHYIKQTTSAEKAVHEKLYCRHAEYDSSNKPQLPRTDLRDALPHVHLYTYAQCDKLMTDDRRHTWFPISFQLQLYMSILHRFRDITTCLKFKEVT